MAVMDGLQNRPGDMGSISKRAEMRRKATGRLASRVQLCGFAAV